jgi:hypothetical protein
LFAPGAKLTTTGPVAVVVDCGTTFKVVGAPGDPTIVGDDATDAALAPTALCALTVHAYVFAAVRPDTVIGPEAAEADPTTPPSLDTQDASYVVIGLPPSLTGSVNDTANGPVVVVTPGVAFTFVGADGTFATVAAFDAAEGALFPAPLVAVTVQV